MYKCVSIRAAEIRKKLKSIGYNRNMVSVKSDSYSGGDSINIRMKSVDVDENKVKEIAKEYESVAVDECTGEVLMGSNSFVFVEWDGDFIEEGVEKYKELAERIYKKDHLLTDYFRWFKKYKSMAVYDSYNHKHQFYADVDGIAMALFFAIDIYKVLDGSDLG